MITGSLRRDDSHVRVGRRTFGSLLRELTDESRTLLRQEVELAKTELSEKAARVGRKAACLAVGALITYAGLLALICAGTIALVQGLDTVMNVWMAAWLAPLIVGVVVAVIGSVVVHKAVATLRKESLTPEKTLDSLREDTQWLRERMT
jgi:uncharacterized membrane protein YqjE